MPFFNYIKSITDYKIKLSHVYYGNFDAQREYNGIAPIVDLSDVIDVMDLSNAVMEFKDTGNAISFRYDCSAHRKQRPACGRTGTKPSGPRQRPQAPPVRS